MPAISPANIGTMKPADLLGAVFLFEGKYGEQE